MGGVFHCLPQFHPPHTQDVSECRLQQAAAITDEIHLSGTVEFAECAAVFFWFFSQLCLRLLGQREGTEETADWEGVLEHDTLSLFGAVYRKELMS